MTIKHISHYQSAKVVQKIYIFILSWVMTWILLMFLLDYCVDNHVCVCFLQVLDEEAEVFIVKMWRLLIYETEAKKIGLVK